ncbi:MAG: homoserine O-acetyltransferase [Anaerolineae bacterium]|nr:homoserine O-acetyltransferase [Anaerolineae bacterium]
MDERSVGIVQTQYVRLFEPPNELRLDSGEKLGPITVAYETYGELNADRSNAIMLCHALSGDAHAAGRHSPDDAKPGWWDDMVGPGKGFDTSRYFVICANVIGGCMGTTGPSSINPRTGRPYGLAFPVVTVADMVRVHRELLRHLGIESLLSVSGGSMGGMQVLQWAVDYPDVVRSAIPIATAAQQSAQGIAFDVVGRRAIMSDPKWRGGNYYAFNDPPVDGLALARMVGHITYLSELSMRRKFGRRLQDRERYGYDFATEFQVESYLYYQGDKFTERFDANTYLYITKAIDYFDLTNGKASLVEAFRGVRAKFLVIAFSSDWLYLPSQSREIVSALKANDVDVSYCEIESDYGHDAFLLEVEEQESLIRNFLAAVARESGVT